MARTESRRSRVEHVRQLRRSCGFAENHNACLLYTSARVLFKASTLGQTGFFGTPWDMARDGQRFLVNTTGEQTDESVAVIVLNWPARLKK